MAVFLPKFQHSAVPMVPVQAPGITTEHHRLTGGAVKGFLQSVEQHYATVNQRRQTANLEQTYFANMRQVENVGNNARASILKNVTVTRNQVLANRAEIEANTLKRFNLKPSDTKEAAEIRTVLREMTPASREEMVRKAFKEKDIAILSAIMGVNTVLTGVSDIVIDACKTQYLYDNDPEMLKVISDNKLELDIVDSFQMEFISAGPMLVYQTESFDEEARKAREISILLGKTYTGENTNPLPEVEEKVGRTVKPATYADTNSAKTPEPSYDAGALPAGAVKVA